MKSVAYTLSALGALTVFSSCNVQTPARDGDKPDPEKITVFYPLGDKVRGRGGPGAVRPGTEFVYIATFPSSGKQVTRANEDGSFEFSVYAGSRDVIELAYSNDKEGKSRGPSIYVDAPLARVFPDDQFCCKESGSAANSLGKCIPYGTAEPDCSGANAFNNCMTTANCAKHSGRNVDFPTDANSVRVASPTQGGAVSVTGKLINAPLAVISVENRGKQGVGLPGKITRKTYDMTDEEGNFELSISAAGDDELVFEIYQLDGQRSREHSKLVPDADFTGLDILGVFPGYEVLSPAKKGRLAVRFAPYGIDGRGICPTPAIGPPQDPVLCFTGGLQYDMVSVDELTLDGQPVEVTRTATTNELPFTRATVGDISAELQVLTLIIDTSVNSFASDPEGIRFRAAKNIVNSVRSRDRVVVLSVGNGDLGYRQETSPQMSQEEILQKIDQLQTQPPEGQYLHNVYGAILEASRVIASQSRDYSGGSIVMINTSDPEGDNSLFRNALRSVVANSASKFEGYITHILNLNTDAQLNGRNLRDLAVFSGGQFIDVTEPRRMLNGSSTLSGLLSGAFILLYDADIPANVGKSASVKVEATVTFPGGTDKALQSQTATFEGTVEIAGAP
ncbi:MAG: hypothetical protein VYC39_08030 [Myxococcota bacterium]|nr:hypothetical protein [Myxococcota bacterium]